jgi:hypothetical protein
MLTLRYSSMKVRKEMNMVKLEACQMQKIVPLFEDIQETLLWSCLQGFMGDANLPGGIAQTWKI